MSTVWSPYYRKSSMHIVSLTLIPYIVLITLALYCSSNSYLLCSISLLGQLLWLNLELNACICSFVDGNNHISLAGWIVGHGICHHLLQLLCIAVETMASCITAQSKQVHKAICTISLGICEQPKSFWHFSDSDCFAHYLPKINHFCIMSAWIWYPHCGFGDGEIHFDMVHVYWY